MTLRGIALSKHIRCTLRKINPFPPIPSFRAQREIFLALRSFLLLSRKDSPSLLSHIRRYTSVQERSLGSARDDVAEAAFSQHIRCTLREINLFPPPSFRAQREIFLALRAFLLPSQKHSRFLLSHIRHYPLLQERSLDFARDDDTGIALSKHIRCTLRKINPFSPHTVISSAARNLPRTPLFLAPFPEGFPFSAISHRTLYRCARKIEGFARDDDTGIALSKHIRCTLREINPFPHTVISSAARNLPCTLFFLVPFTKGFPFSAITHTTLSLPARKIPRLRSG